MALDTSLRDAPDPVGSSLLSYESIAPQALALPTVIWATSYNLRDDGTAWDLVSSAGAVPLALHSFALPVDRLPPPIVHALLNDRIEVGGIPPLWLTAESGCIVTEQDVAVLANIVVIPLRVGLLAPLLLLLGCSQRHRDLAPFNAFRSQIEESFKLVDLPETMVERLGIDESECRAALAEENRRLTQLPALFRIRLEIELIRAQRYQRQLTILTFALSHPDFLVIPEIVLIEVARVLRDQLRRTDLVGRVATNVIGVILTETHAGSARWVSQRLRTKVSEYLAGVDRTCRVEMGLAAKPELQEGAAALILRALNNVIRVSPWSNFHELQPASTS